MSARFKIKHTTSLNNVDESAYWVKPVPLDKVGASKLANTTLFKIAGGNKAFVEIDICSFERNSNCLNFWRGSVLNWLKETKLKQFAEQKLNDIIEPRAEFAGLNMCHNHLMGIVNVTPDSFSDGGQFLVPEKAVQHAVKLKQDGATIIDIGGESTRPGSNKIDSLEEERRVLPVLQELSKHNSLISVDTRNPVIMRKALYLGARIINDISGFRNREAIQVVIDAFKNGFSPHVIIMHMQGEPSTMQEAPSYKFTPIDIYIYLEKQINLLVSSGLPKSCIAVDVGFGFGKSVSDNLTLIDWMPMFHGLGVPILVGVSRKSTIGKIDNNAAVDKRLGGSIALTLRSIDAGVQMIRSHDIQETMQAIKLWQVS